MYRNIVFWGIAVLLSSNSSLAQHKPFRSSTTDVFSFGIGVGIDHGGVGGTLIYYPTRNIGFFGAGGYAVAGFAYNVGAKLRMTHSQIIHPFVSAMYGHNAAVAVNMASQSKLFSGPTLGGGVDIHLKDSRSYFSLTLLVPIKNAEVDEYVNSQVGRGISFNSTSMPAIISIGYRIIIKDNDY